MKRPAAQAYICTIAFGLAQVDSVALAKTKGLLPCVQREDLAEAEQLAAATTALVPQPLTPWAPA